MRRILGSLLAILLLGGSAHAVPLGPADLASVRASAIALEADPFADEPLRALADAYQRGPGMAALHREFQKRAAQKPPSLAALIVLARIELMRGRRADAVHDLALAVGPVTPPAILRRLGRMLDDNGAMADAIRAYQGGRVGATPQELREVLLRLGALLLARNGVKEASAVWDEAKRLAPQDQLLRRQIAEAFASHSVWSQGLAELKEIEPLVEKEPVALITILRREADFARRMSDRELATLVLLRAYRAATALPQSPLRGEITIELLRLYRADASVPVTARARGAAELAKVAEKAEGGFPGAAALVGEARIGAGDTAGALLGFRRALKASPQDPYLLRRLCDLETGEARIHDLALYFDLNRGDAAVGLDLVAALFAAKRPEEAVDKARLIQARFIDNSLILLETARLLRGNGQAVEALKLDERALRLDPDNLDAVIAYADDLHAAGRPADATRAYFRLVGKNPTPNSYRRLIALLSQRNLPDDLKRAYQDAVARQPDDHELRRDYARWLTSTKSFDAALVQWKIILDQSKNSFLRAFAEREIQRIENQRLLDR